MPITVSIFINISSKSHLPTSPQIFIKARGLGPWDEFVLSPWPLTGLITFSEALESCAKNVWTWTFVLNRDWRQIGYFWLQITFPMISASSCLHRTIPVGIYMFKVNNRKTRTRCEISLKLKVTSAKKTFLCDKVTLDI